MFPTQASALARFVHSTLEESPTSQQLENGLYEISFGRTANGLRLLRDITVHCESVTAKPEIARAINMHPTEIVAVIMSALESIQEPVS
jgi:hypothetical protein